MGMWVVELDHDKTGAPFTGIIHLDSVLQAVQLMGM